MPMRRSIRRRPGAGLVNTVARTAVIAGTARMTSNAIDNRAMHRQQAQADRAREQGAVAEMQEQLRTLQAQQLNSASPASGGSASTSGGDMVARLQQLADLHAAGALTAEEFAAAKARALS